MNLLGVFVIVFTALTMGIGFWSYFGLKGKAVNYYKAGAMMPVWVVGITLCAQAFDANGSIGTAAMSYESGFWAGAAIPLGLGACLFITGAFFAGPIHRMNLMTLPDFYRRRYSNSTETLASLSMLVSNIILIAGNLAGLGLLFSMVFGFGYLPMLILVSACLLAYAVTGGFLATVWTSVFQVAVFVIGMLASFFWVTHHFGWEVLMADVPAEHRSFAGLTEIGHGSLLNWAALVSLGLGDVVAIDFIQRVISSDSARAARRGCFIGGIMTIAVGIPVALIGLYAFHLNKVADKNVLVSIAKSDLPEVLGILVVLGIIGASMSTAAGVILDLANVITRNLVQRHMKKKWNNETMLRFSRFIAVPTMAAAALFAYVRPEPGTLLILAFDVVLAGCFVPLVLGLYWRKANAAAAISSIVAGAILRITLYYTVPDALAGLDTMLPPAISLVVFVVVAMTTQKISEPKHHALDYVPSEQELVTGEY